MKVHQAQQYCRLGIWFGTALLPIGDRFRLGSESKREDRPRHVELGSDTDYLGCSHLQGRAVFDAVLAKRNFPRALSGLVELHGGRIRADSAGIGQGSVFTVELPVLEEQPAPEVSVTASQGHASRRILVVDDNIDAADTLVMALEILGHVVRTVCSASYALVQAREFEPSLILLDIGLPDLNGYEVARRIRAASWGSEITLVAATGRSPDADPSTRT